jgi:glycosyltransferase involved in cell wall biosynthesis
VPRVALVSFRLGGGDGVSIEARKWVGAFAALGWDVTTVAGSGTADVILPGLGLPDAAGHPPGPPTESDVRDALDGSDIVVVENLCSLPLNPGAADVVAAVCRGRPTVLHHHDLPWQRARFAHSGPPPDDPAWRHVTINQLSRRELATRRIRATTIYNTFDPSPPPGERQARRAALGLGHDDLLVLQPTRALERKNVGAGIDLATRLGATFWLLGPAEDGYGPELDRLVARAGCRVLLGNGDDPPVGPGFGIDDAYAACDVVALPSTWEGFGNPAVESATHDRPLVIGPYPVAAELAAFGFDWFGLDDADGLAGWLAGDDTTLLADNHAVAARWFNVADLPARLASVLEDIGHRPRSGGYPPPDGGHGQE